MSASERELCKIPSKFVRWPPAILWREVSFLSHVVGWFDLKSLSSKCISYSNGCVSDWNLCWPPHYKGRLAKICHRYGCLRWCDAKPFMRSTSVRSACNMSGNGRGVILLRIFVFGFETCGSPRTPLRYHQMLFFCQVNLTAKFHTQKSIKIL